ncbi:MAG TPA: T9SS type A sorting domain-containing protein [Bacteroidia bacterium]|nr:T9SS type A sorting domain-containing protein [Bacteroidia bacterium]
MKKKALLIYFTFLFVFASYSSFSQNINLSNSQYFDGECNLVVNPLNPKHLVSAWIYFSLSNLKDAIATRSSFDGGKTWTPLQILPHIYSSFNSADPTMYFGKDSCVYLAYIDLSGLKASDSGYIMVVRSTNGGITWKAPVKAIYYKAQPNLPIDRPWIAADGTNGPYAGRVYLTTQNAYFAPQPHHPWFTYSADSGATWAPIKQLDDSIPTGAITDATAFTTVAANGTLYGFYYSYYTAYSPYARLIMVKSFNGGTSFTTHAALNFTAADVIPTADSLLKSGLCVSSNPTDTSNLILLSPSEIFGEPDVVSFNSNDAGKTWNGPIRLNDDTKGAYDTCHDLNWGGFAKNGTFGAVWRDRRNTSKGDSASFQIYGTTSTDGGNSYGKNFLVSDTISPPVYIERGDDFLGCAVTDSNVYALWSDMRTGKENTFFNSTSIGKSPSAVVTIGDNSRFSAELFPNPSHNKTNIVINAQPTLKEGILTIYSIDGRKEAEIKIPGSGMYILDLPSLSAGTYIWSLTEDAETIAHGKWVVQ